MKKIIGLLFVGALVFSDFVRADYIVATRDMLLKNAPEVNANTVATIKKKDKLLIVGDGHQQNGYYNVELADGSIGYVYRTVGRLVVEEDVPTSDIDSDPIVDVDDQDTSCGRHLVFGVPDKSDQVLYGVWGYVEDLERKWIKERGELIVIAGSYVPPNAEHIGDGVAIPSHFYRILFDPVKLESLAFWFSHDVNTAENITSYLTSVDEIESKTGIDFFNYINIDIQNALESKSSKNIWN